MNHLSPPVWRSRPPKSPEEVLGGSEEGHLCGWNCFRNQSDFSFLFLWIHIHCILYKSSSRETILLVFTLRTHTNHLSEKKGLKIQGLGQNHLSRRCPDTERGSVKTWFYCSWFSLGLIQCCWEQCNNQRSHCRRDEVQGMALPKEMSGILDWDLDLGMVGMSWWKAIC